MTLKGVNLGGWLVLERWITPSVFDGLAAQDEYSFCLEAKDKLARLEKHRQGFIGEADFKWLAGNGINAIRIPVPHWLFGGFEPYVPAVEYLVKAMEWAHKYDLQVLLDIHTAPGSQNGRLHSGRSGEIGWHKDKCNVSASLGFVDQLCQRYGGHSALWGIELLNEPRAWISPRVLKSYYLEGYKLVRQYCGDGAAVVISDYFAPWRWAGFMPEPKFKNVVRDTHLYQCHKPADKKLNMAQHIDKAGGEWKDLMAKNGRSQPLIIGEWSLALDNQTFEGMDERQKNEALKAYANAQLSTFEDTSGWFYWTYKTETDSLWSYKNCLERGFLV